LILIHVAFYMVLDFNTGLGLRDMPPIRTLAKGQHEQKAVARLRMWALNERNDNTNIPPSFHDPLVNRVSGYMMCHFFLHDVPSSSAEMSKKPPHDMYYLCDQKHRLVTNKE
jgi:hypothetical protein